MDRSWRNLLMLAIFSAAFCLALAWAAARAEAQADAWRRKASEAVPVQADAKAWLARRFADDGAAFTVKFIVIEEGPAAGEGPS